jgi:hypothetical protein
MTPRYLFFLTLTMLTPAGLPAQTRSPTVGDTIWLTQRVAVPAGFTVRAPDWDPSDPIELLGRPVVTAGGDSAEITYPVVAWLPGHHQLDIPGPLLLGPGGNVDSLRGERVRIDVASVLPPVPVDSYLPPQPRASLVNRHVTTFGPLALAWGVALLLLLPLHLWWRRRGKTIRAQPPSIPADALEPPLERWADAGEYRAVASVSTARLRAAVADRIASAHPALDTERVLAEIAAVRPQWPVEELSDLLRALDDARFGVSPAPDALELCRSSMDLRERLLRAAA